MAAADKEQRGRHLVACLAQAGALLDEGAEGRDACAGGDHDQRGVGHVADVGEVKGRVRSLDGDGDVVARVEIAEEGGGDAEEAFACCILESGLVEEAKG